MSDIGFLLKVIEDNAERHANQVFRQMELTSSQVRVLKFLRERKDVSTTQKELEQYLMVSHPTVVGIVQRLEHKGFLQTQFDGEDRRNKYIYLTEKEAELFERIRRCHEEMELLLTRGMTEEQIAQLRELLQIVYRNVKQP